MLKQSKYNIIKELSSRNYIIYNTFTTNFSIINEKIKEKLLNLKLSNKEKEEMLNKGFLIDSNYDEKEILKEERLKETFDEEYQHYTIYTTYECNANCFYCFEKNKRKAYRKIANSFDLVINNIEEIIKSKLQISVRINFDDVIKLLVFLSKFNEYNNFRCYVMPLYRTSKYNKENYIDENNCSIFFGKLFSKMIELKYIKNQKYFLLKRNPLFCKALKKNTWVIDTKGSLYKCSHSMEKEICSIYNKEVDELELKNWERIHVDDNCDKCIFLPLCQGGCNCLKNENSCGNRCFIYKYCFDEVLNSILKLNNIPYEIRRNINECSYK